MGRANNALAQTLRNKFTQEWSSRRYQMEYETFKFNHLLHGVMALYDLGASESMIESYAKSYTAKLVPVPEEDKPATETLSTSLTHETARELLGKQTHFNELRALYESEVKVEGADATIRRHLPTLVDGLAGSLFHTIIHMGYSYHLGCDRSIAEALAYMHSMHLAFDDPENPYRATKSINTDREKFVRKDALMLAKSLGDQDVVLSEIKDRLAQSPLKDLSTSGLQKVFMSTSSDPKCGSIDAFRTLADTIDQYDLTEFDGTVALDFSLWVYTMLGHNDFVILHAVTAAWGLHQVEHLLEHDDRVRAWRVWLQVTLSAYISRDTSDLLDHDICEGFENQVSGLADWNDIVEQALQRDTLAETHAYKLVQVARDHANEKSTSNFLTSDERDFIGRKAALKVLSEDYGFKAHPKLAA